MIHAVKAREMAKQHELLNLEQRITETALKGGTCLEVCLTNLTANSLKEEFGYDVDQLRTVRNSSWGWYRVSWR